MFCPPGPARAGQAAPQSVPPAGGRSFLSESIMKAKFPGWVLLLLALTLVFAPLAYAAASRAPARTDRSPGAAIATTVSTVTGIAISPLLGSGALGAYKWFTAKDEAARTNLSWYAQPKFWVPALLLVLAVAIKDSMGASVPPGWKKPLDVLETIENKFSGLIAAGAVIPFALDAMAEMLLKPDPVALAAPAATGLAMIVPAAIDWSPVLTVLALPFGLVVFAVVWLASHAINVLILLSPWGAIDAALKAVRAGLLGLVTLTATLDPKWGAILSLVIIGLAFLLAGWAWRLTVFGAVFCWDFLTRRRKRFTPVTDGNRMFAGANFPGVPVRAYGRLVRRGDGALDFQYRKLPGLPLQSATVPVESRSLAVGQGLFFSNIIAADGRTLLLLPPRYRCHEAELAEIHGFGGGVRDAGLRKAWSALREMLGGKALAPEPVEAPA